MEKETMEMSNSTLIEGSYTSHQKRTHPRNNKVLKITPHHCGGNMTFQGMKNEINRPDRQMSCNYLIQSDGRRFLFVNEEDRSWCSSNANNDNQAVTIEVANDGGAPDWHVSDKALASLIELCVDICKRNDISQLNFTGDANGNLTQHNYFSATACPGPYLKNKFPYIAAEVNQRLRATVLPDTTEEVSQKTGFLATDLKNLSEAEIIAKIGPLFTEDQKKTGVLACVSLAQFILESSYGKSELAQNANNCFGMKISLSGNTWADSTWDGTKYAKQTQEYTNGQYITITSDFRKYSCVEHSIADHSAYLLGSMNGAKKRYEGLQGLTDYKTAFQLIKDGGYATSPTYVTNLCAVVENWGLTKYDVSMEEVPDSSPDKVLPDVPFTVRVLVDDLCYYSDPSTTAAIKGKTGKGLFTIVKTTNLWGKLKSGVGWILLNDTSRLTIQDSASTNKADSYTVRVEMSNLNIRKGPGNTYATNGLTGKGVFTIIDEAVGPGSIKGWGKLKSGVGWISLDYVTKTI